MYTKHRSRCEGNSFCSTQELFPHFVELGGLYQPITSRNVEASDKSSDT